MNANTATFTLIRKLIYTREEKIKPKLKGMRRNPHFFNFNCCVTTDEKMTAMPLKKEKITQHSEHILEVHPQMNTHYFSATYNNKLPVKIQV